MLFAGNVGWVLQITNLKDAVYTPVLDVIDVFLKY